MVQVDQTINSRKGAEQTVKDNMYLIWKVGELEKVISHYEEYGKMPEFTPLD